MLSTKNILYASFVIFISSTFVLIAALLFYLLRPGPSSYLGTYVSPWNIIGVSELHVGESVTIRGLRCTEINRFVEVEATVFLRRIDGGYLYYDLSAAVMTRQPKCNTATLIVNIPLDAPLGVYRVEGFDRSIATGEIKTWFSEEFEVLKK